MREHDTMSNKPTWIFCCGMRRSGSTAQYNIVQDITAGTVVDLGFVPLSNMDGLIARHDSGDVDVLLKCHAHLLSRSTRCWELVCEGRIQAVYIYRDIRDVMASCVRVDPEVRNPKRSNYLWRFETLLHDTLDEYYAWMSLPSDLIHVVMYEDIAGYLYRDAFEIAWFLKQPMGMDDAKIVAERYSIENQQDYIASRVLGEGSHRVGRGEPDERVLWSNHIGEHEADNPFGIGQYKDILTVEEIDMVERVGSRWLTEHGYE